eukprot:m.194162 g.194162  ORF g.194162 m.194162 type:complete len:54 (-) comp16787_c9_seq2:283-444(-)
MLLYWMHGAVGAFSKDKPMTAFFFVNQFFFFFDFSIVLLVFLVHICMCCHSKG